MSRIDFDELFQWESFRFTPSGPLYIKVDDANARPAGKFSDSNQQVGQDVQVFRLGDHDDEAVADQR